jgi:hypothetical protein
VGLGAIIVIIGIVVAVARSLLLGLLIVLLGLALGGFRRGRWY